ncbi:ABC transporter substrate-binding protein [Paracoccus seriniphilus]|uniref:Amino acid/amide ABC transporter substrate-binding protein, HAAT family n=1 Tax=Paracoccus seriniphilus TaxID=184748 RepID=A0A239Q163_9RHOB|nr:ABC transporter substrate-binding protein [Paracoccus seriniphilus]WCR15780.1 ABC transporter substrate-binding protein [Paracoccus seriniphilus]SNT76170.1 amino acid/amide ABC transporter substrate-binding protein, HAAT family [Paracoccus seriniphilus]
MRYQCINLFGLARGNTVVAAAIMAALSAQAASSDTISLGAPIPLTGYLAADGATMERAIRLAVDELNANGGVLGNQVDVVTFDIGDLTPDKLSAAAANLIEREGVSALINGYGGMGPDIPAFCPYGIPYIHNDAVSSVIDLAERMHCDAVFNASDVDVNYGKAVFQQMLATGYEFESKRLAIVHGDYEWDVEVAKGMTEAAQAAGWEVVFSEEVPYDTVEWTGILSKIRATEPALVHLEALDPAVATTFISQFNDNPAGNALVSVGYMGATPGLDDVIAQGNAQGVLAFTLNAHLEDEEGGAFEAKWQDAYGAEAPISLAAAVYDMVNMWAAAVEQAGDASDYAAVADAIRGMDYDGIAGIYAFNDRNFIDTGSQTQPAQLIQVQDGKRVRLVVGDEKVGEIVAPSWGN